MNARQQRLLCLATLILVIVVDQCIKVYVKTHFYLHESVEVTSWFYLTFIENNGMAYGVELLPKMGLTIFRILCTLGFGWLLLLGIRRGVATGFAVTASAVIAGAVGNIIDCVAYGQLFTDSYGHLATWADASAGLQPAGDWFEGRVVDMFYFPLVRFDWPASWPVAGQAVEWLGMRFAWPSWAPCSDEPFMFFKPVFNFADAAITTGIATLLLFYAKTFRDMELWLDDIRKKK